MVQIKSESEGLDEAVIDDEVGAGDVAGAAAGEQDDRVGRLLGCAERAGGRLAGGSGRLALAALLAAALVAVAAGPADAHQPVFLRPGDTRGPLLVDGTVSFAVYGTMTARARSGRPRPSALRVRYRSGDPVLIDLLVPDRRPERGLPRAGLPTVTITRPGGRATVLRATTRVRFTEPFSHTSYLRLSRFRGRAGAGTWTVRVAGTRPSRFVVAVGVNEVRGRVTDYRPPVGASVAAWYATPPRS